MEEIAKTIIEGIMDAIEEFFDAMVVPTQRYVLDAFFVSCGFLAWSIIAWLFDIFTFVDWQEALTCTILLGIVVLIDTSSRSAIKGNLNKIKALASKFTYSGEEEDEELNQEVVEDESGE